MEARNARVADPLVTVHREMDSMFGSHRLTMYAICVVDSNRTTHPGEGACQPIHTMNLQW